ncbi:hypothetical protein [Pseudomonas phage BL2]|nr:hypothetical protein [Pseudomonas phage BL2]
MSQHRLDAEVAHHSPRAFAKSTGSAVGEILHIRLRPLFDAKGDELALNQLAEHAAAIGAAIDGRVHFFDEEDQGVFRRLVLHLDAGQLRSRHDPHLRIGLFDPVRNRNAVRRGHRQVVHFAGGQGHGDLLGLRVDLVLALDAQLADGLTDISDDACPVGGGPALARRSLEWRQVGVIQETIGAVAQAALPAVKTDGVAEDFQTDGRLLTLGLCAVQANGRSAALFQSTHEQTQLTTNDGAALEVGVPAGQRDVGVVTVFHRSAGRLNDTLNDFLVFPGANGVDADDLIDFPRGGHDLHEPRQPGLKELDGGRDGRRGHRGGEVAVHGRAGTECAGLRQGLDLVLDDGVIEYQADATQGGHGFVGDVLQVEWFCVTACEARMGLTDMAHDASLLRELDDGNASYQISRRLGRQADGIDDTRVGDLNQAGWHGAGLETDQGASRQAQGIVGGRQVVRYICHRIAVAQIQSGFCAVEDFDDQAGGHVEELAFGTVGQVIAGSQGIAGRPVQSIMLRVTEDSEEGRTADHDFRSARGNGLRLAFTEGTDITCVTKRATDAVGAGGSRGRSDRCQRHDPTRPRTLRAVLDQITRKTRSVLAIDLFLEHGLLPLQVTVQLGALRSRTGRILGFRLTAGRATSSFDAFQVHVERQNFLALLTADRQLLHAVNSDFSRVHSSVVERTNHGTKTLVEAIFSSNVAIETTNCSILRVLLCHFRKFLAVILALTTIVAGGLRAAEDALFFQVLDDILTFAMFFVRLFGYRAFQSSQNGLDLGDQFGDFAFTGHFGCGTFLLFRLDGDHGRIDNGRRFFVLFVVFLSAFQSRMLGHVLAVGRFGRSGCAFLMLRLLRLFAQELLDRCRELRPQGAQLFDRRISSLSCALDRSLLLGFLETHFITLIGWSEIKTEMVKAQTIQYSGPRHTTLFYQGDVVAAHLVLDDFIRRSIPDAGLLSVAATIA